MYKARWHHRWTMRRAFVVSPFPHFIYKYIYIYRAVWTAPVDDDDLASTFPSSRAIGTWANTSRSSFIFPPFLILKTGRHDPFASNFSFVAFFFLRLFIYFLFFSTLTIRVFVSFVVFNCVGENTNGDVICCSRFFHVIRTIANKVFPSPLTRLFPSLLFSIFFR